MRPGDGAQQRRFPRSGPAEQCDDLSGAQVEVDVIEHEQRVAGRTGEALADVLDVDQYFVDGLVMATTSIRNPGIRTGRSGARTSA